VRVHPKEEIHMAKTKGRRMIQVGQPTRASQPTPASQPTRASQPTQASRAPQAAQPVAAPTPKVAEAPVRVMTVCVPEQLSTEVLNSTRQLDRHLSVAATMCARLWASPKLHMWQRGQMVDLRKGRRPVYCAGGPVRLLDLAGMRYGASLGAGIRYQLWTDVVGDTRPAASWRVFLERHLNDPGAYPMDTMQTAFDNQPRVLAMRMHNATVHGAAHLAVEELEMFQAGSMAYQNYHALWSVCTDALLTADGVQRKPKSDSLADKVTYLDQANRFIESLDDTQRLITVTL
jgi:hypothetical protein